MSTSLSDSFHQQSVVVRPTEIVDNLTPLPATGLKVRVVHLNMPFARVAFVGALNAETASLAANALATAVERRCARIEADVQDLAFCDAAGFGVFAEIHQMCVEGGGGLRLLNPQPPLVRLLEITGLDVLMQTALGGDHPGTLTIRRA